MNKLEFLHKLITTTWRIIKKYVSLPPTSENEWEQFSDEMTDAFATLAEAVPKGSPERYFTFDIMTAVTSYFQRRNKEVVNNEYV